MELRVAIDPVVGAKCVGRYHGPINGRTDCLIRATDGKTYEIFTVTGVLRREDRFMTLKAALNEGLVSCAPRCRAEVIPVLVRRICCVLFYPFIRVTIVAVLAFNGVPFVREFRRRRGTRLIARFRRFKYERVIKNASYVASRVLRWYRLATGDDRVSDHARQTRVIIVTCPLRFAILAVRRRSLVDCGLGTTSAGAHNVFIDLFTVCVGLECYLVWVEYLEKPREQDVCRGVLLG